MAIPLGDPGLSPPPQPTSKRWSVFRRAFRGAGWVGGSIPDWMGVRRISRSGAFIGHLLGLLRGGPRRDDRFKVGEGGRFNLPGAALAYGVSVSELEARLVAQRRRTARIAYAAFALACLFFAGWLWQALSSPWNAVRIASMVYFLPFCALLVLVGFYHALLNFQIRIGRMASWREYLATDEPFWPG